MEEIFTTLKQLQKDSGQSIRSIAREMGTSAAHLHRVLNGEISPTVNTIARFAKAIGKTTSIFFEPRKVSAEENYAKWIGEGTFPPAV